MGDISRRHLLVSIAAAAGGYPALMSTVAAQAPNLDASTIAYRSGQVDVSGYLVKPRGRRSASGRRHRP
jgi:hypothetical protein